jgi:hypothetical protein
MLLPPLDRAPRGISKTGERGQLTCVRKKAAGSPAGLLALFLTYLGLCLVLLTGMRVLLLLAFRAKTGAPAELPMLFATGLRFDLLLMSYLLLPAWLLACLAPTVWVNKVKTGLRWYLLTLLGVMTFLECAAWPALVEFGSRPEALFLEYLKHGSQVGALVYSGFWRETFVTVLAVGSVLWIVHRQLRRASTRPWPRWRTRL